MTSRWVILGPLMATPIAALALFQGMVTVGLVPLAVFAPAYALAHSMGTSSSRARREAARVAIAGTAGIGLALLPALSMGGRQSPPWITWSLTVVAAGTGALAALACAPATEKRTLDDEQRWAFVQAMDDRHARGLALLALVALAAGTLVALLREAKIVPVEAPELTLPQALFGSHLVGGSVVLPEPTATVAVAVPLSLAPLALGFLTSPKRAAPLALGGLAVLPLAPLVSMLDVPVQASTGAWVPLSILEHPGLGAVRALAPAAAGLLVGAALVHAASRFRSRPQALRAFWALGALLVTLLVAGLVPALAIAAAALATGLVLALAADRAPLGLAVLFGAAIGGIVHVVAGMPSSVAAGALVGVTAGSAAATYGASRAIDVPGEVLRSPWMLAYAIVAVLSVGLAYRYVGPGLAGGMFPFPVPHARALSAGLAGLLDGQGGLLVVWGLVAGGLIELLVGSGAWLAVGVLAGPGVAVLVLVGSLLRAAWEKGLLDRAREGYVMRGQLGYELLRVHVLVVGVLAGEGLAMILSVVLG